MKKVSISFCFLFIAILAFAQDEFVVENKFLTDNKVDIGLGMGLDYGGFGGRITVLPSQHVGVFGGLGYALAGVGYNFGFNYRISPDKRVVPVLHAMYGYNAALKITGDFEVNKLYYGPSFGFGLNFKNRWVPKNFFNIELLVPIRDSQYERDLQFYEDLGVSFNQTFPITITLGYHFGISK
jgi:hypothetical protein